MEDAPLELLLAGAEAARDRGALAEGLGLAKQAWRRLDGAPALLRRRGGVLLTHLAYRTGALSTMVEVALCTLPLLRASGPASELIDLLRATAIGGCETGRFDIGLSCAQEAHRVALEIADPARVALSLNSLAVFFERSGDPWQAERLLVEALQAARQQPDPAALFVTLNNLGAALIGKFYLLRDAVPLAQAREPLLSALPHAREAAAMADAGSEVFHRVFAQGNLGEILVNLGQDCEARQALDTALALAHTHGFEAQVWRIGCSMGELSLLQGRPQQAWQQLQDVAAASAQADQRATHMRLQHALWRCAAALEDPVRALHHLQQYLLIERQRSVAQLHAQSDLFVTRMEAEQMRRDAQRHQARATALELDLRRDALTGLGNRRELEQRWPELLRQSQRSGTPLSVAMLDLDHFKQVNDHHGHATGDRVLVTLGGLLREHTRHADLLVRLGGEEFLVVLPDTDARQAAEVCERLRACVAGFAWQTLAPGLQVTLSIGVASTPAHPAESLSLQADTALYRAKSHGRKSVVQV